MLDFAWSALRAAGYQPYYLYRQKYHVRVALKTWAGASPAGQRCLYNICMMEELHTVLSLGAGGRDQGPIRRQGRVRRLANPKYPQEYLQNAAAIQAEKSSWTW